MIRSLRMNFSPQGTAAVKLKVAFSCLKRKYKKEIEIGNVFCSMRHDYASHIYVTILWIFRTVCKCLGAFCEKTGATLNICCCCFL